MVLYVDIPWLLEIQETRMEELSVRDYSGLVAAVARHKTTTPQLGAELDAAWRAAALLHTLTALRPLPVRNSLYACMVTVAYMHASGEGIDPPFGELVELTKDLVEAKTDVFGAADRIRNWRI